MITHIQSGVRECEEMIMQGARMKQTIQNILKESTGQRRRKCSAGSEEVQRAWVEVQGGVGASAGRHGRKFSKEIYIFFHGLTAEK